MAFITAFLWGAGISLGLCVGLAAWLLIRPVVTRDKEDWSTIREYNRQSLVALYERNGMTSEMNEYLDRIANALEEYPQHKAGDNWLPRTGDGVVIVRGNTVFWMCPMRDDVREGIVEEVSEGVWGDNFHGEYTILWHGSGNEGSWKLGNLDCYSTLESARTAKALKNE